MGTGPGYRKEFWWEREWRRLGNLALPPRYIVLCPEADQPRFKSVLSNGGSPAMPFVDPRWSLEQIVAKLAGFSDADIDVF